MKRPFAAVGFTAFAVLLALSYAMSSRAALCACLCFAAAGIFSIIVRPLRQTVTVPVCLITAAAVCLLFLGFIGEVKHTQSLAGEDVGVTATVSEAPYMKKTNGRYYCVLSIETVRGERVSGKLRLSFSPTGDELDPDSLQIGNRVSFRGKVYIPAEGEKSISRYFTGENILLGAYGVSDFTCSEPSSRGVNYYFHRIRSFVSERLRYGFGDRIAGLLIGILTGDRSVLDDELYDAFRETGIAHLMAVSGLHLSVWVYSLGALIPEKGKTAKLKYLLLISAVLFVMLLAGMSESVKRAGFMSLVYLSGKLSSHRSDSLNSLGLAVFVMILFNPMCVLSVSLQLSFLSTLGIVTLGQLYIKRSADFLGGKSINSPAKKLARYFTDVFFISISVLVFTFPVLIYNFGGISTVSAWVNILISPVVTPLLMLSGAYVLLSGISPVALVLGLIVRLISEYIIFVASGFLRVKNAFLVYEAESLPLYLAAAVLIAFLSLAFFKRSNARARTALVLAAVITCVGLVAFYEQSERAVKIHLCDYEGEIAVAVEWDKRAVLLTNPESYERGLFESYIESRGAELAAVKRGERYQCAADGKYIYDFSCEALQCAEDCDIMIEKYADGTVIGIDGDEFFLDKGEKLTVKR